MSRVASRPAPRRASRPRPRRRPHVVPRRREVRRGRAAAVDQLEAEVPPVVREAEPASRVGDVDVHGEAGRARPARGAASTRPPGRDERRDARRGRPVEREAPRQQRAPGEVHGHERRRRPASSAGRASAAATTNSGVREPAAAGGEGRAAGGLGHGARDGIDAQDERGRVRGRAASSTNRPSPVPRSTMRPPSSAPAPERESELADVHLGDAPAGHDAHARQATCREAPPGQAGRVTTLARDVGPAHPPVRGRAVGVPPVGPAHGRRRPRARPARRVGAAGDRRRARRQLRRARARRQERRGPRDRGGPRRDPAPRRHPALARLRAPGRPRPVPADPPDAHRQRRSTTAPRSASTSTSCRPARGELASWCGSATPSVPTRPSATPTPPRRSGSSTAAPDGDANQLYTVHKSDFVQDALYRLGIRRGPADAPEPLAPGATIGVLGGGQLGPDARVRGPRDGLPAGRPGPGPALPDGRGRRRGRRGPLRRRRRRPPARGRERRRDLRAGARRPRGRRGRRRARAAAPRAGRAAGHPGPARRAAVHPGHRRVDGAVARGPGRRRGRGRRRGAGLPGPAQAPARRLRRAQPGPRRGPRRGRRRRGVARRGGRAAAAPGERRSTSRRSSRSCARGTATGRTLAFPVSRNVHDAGILVESVAPAPVHPLVAHDAREIADSIARGLDLVGVLDGRAVPAAGRRADDQRAGAAGAQLAATGRSRARRPRSSSSTCARSSGCRSGRWRRTA